MTERTRTVVHRIVAAEFLLGAITKYWPGTGPFGQDYAIKFTQWGYPPDFRFVVGTLELLCAVLLLAPRKPARFLGATGLVLVLTGAVTTHIIAADPLTQSLAAPLHLIIAAAIAIANWPPDCRHLLRPWQPAGTP
ncbi:DoxX family protein [Streptomyces sp. A7024]|uniref:DoxX family protein n=2 Tax=Streptomyces coryli TaxID=1128680 RepID=A0A6G4TR99_9ACTN|nr:DoxX family protein [Streptomyces coryli]